MGILKIKRNEEDLEEGKGKIGIYIRYKIKNKGNSDVDDRAWAAMKGAGNGIAEHS